MKQILIIGAVALFIIGGIAYGTREQTQKTTDPITIGAIISQTGFAAAFGEMSQQGMELAVAEINANGGIDGRPVVLQIEDDATDPKTAAGLYQKLTSVDGLSAIIGSNFDFVTQPLFALAETGPAVVVSPSNPRIAGSFDTNAQSFVMMSDFAQIIGGLEGYLNDTSYTKLGIVRFDSAFSAEITRNLTEMTVADGKPAPVVETYQTLGGNDFRTAILKLKQENVDLVFIDMIGTDSGVFLKQAAELEYAPQVVAHVGLVDALSSGQFASDLFEGVVMLDWNETPVDFREKFVKAYGVEPTNSANRAYDAVYILADAIATVGTDAAAIAAHLADTSFETPNGTFTFTAEHAARETQVALRVVRNGAFVHAQ
jgi:branched-chain amino acid transport system substrate-binding protein